MRPILQFDGVVRRYPSFTFGPLDLEVLPGESVALAGSNGSGKSTLLRLAAGLVRADQGQVQIAGALLPRDAVAARERVALVTEDAALYAAATLRWHIELVASLVPRWDAARARGLAEAFGLDPAWQLAGRVVALDGGRLADPARAAA